MAGRSGAGPSPCAVAAAVWAFVRRGVATYASYRAKLSLGLASIVGSVVTFAFVGEVVSRAGPGFAERYGMEYSAFVLTGVLVHSVAAAGLHVFRSAVRREQLQGTLEFMFASPLPAPLLVVLAGLGELVVTALGGLALLGAAAALIGFRLPLSPPSIAAIFLYALVMCGAGMASAGTILVSKEGDPVTWVFGSVAGILGGVYFPVDVLPEWLAPLARGLPTTHALEVARSTLGGSTPGSTARSLAFLGVAAAASVAVGLSVLTWGNRRARLAGTLGQY